MSLKGDIKDYLKGLQESQKVSAVTRAAYRADLDKLTAFADERGISKTREIDERFLEDFLSALLGKGVSESTIKRETACLHGFFAFLKKEGRIRRDPSYDLSGVKTSRGAKKKESAVPLTQKELEALLAAPAGEKTQERDRAILELFASTGLHAGELIRLRVRDIDFLMDCVIVEGEDGDKRRIPFTERTEKVLVAYIESAGENLPSRESLLFPGRDTKPITRQGVWKLVRKYGERTKIAGSVTPVRLRATLEADLKQRGIPDKRIDRILGRKEKEEEETKES